MAGLQRFWPFAMPASTIVPMPAHPFYPLNLKIDDYVANDSELRLLMGGFLGCWVLILGATWMAASRFAPQLKKMDKLILIWFVLTGTIHFFFEGYFVLNHYRMTSAQDLVGQLWKEYALSDSRYMFSDPFVLCMESITAVIWGPLSYLTAVLIAKSHPLRHSLQAIVSLGQIYGDLLYFATSLFDLYFKNLSYCRPEAYYFWFYFVFMNMIWIVIPGLLLYQSVTKTVDAFQALDNISQVYAGNSNSRMKAPRIVKANGQVH